MMINWDTFTYDETWLREGVQQELEMECDVQIGCSSHSSRPIDPEQLNIQLQQVQIQGLLFGELDSLLERANLGSGKEAALVRGRQLIRLRISLLSVEQREYFKTLIEAEREERSPLRAELGQVLCSLLSEADWQEIFQSAIELIRTNFHIVLRQSA